MYSFIKVPKRDRIVQYGNQRRNLGIVAFANGLCHMIMKRGRENPRVF